LALRIRLSWAEWEKIGEVLEDMRMRGRKR
jgi:hypothetical protein